MKKKIIFITGSRAEYGIIKNILKSLSINKIIKPLLVVLGSHKNSNFGSSIKEIVEDKLKIDFIINIPTKNTKESAVKLISKSSEKISKYYEKNKPDAIFVTGDRYEILSAVYPAIIYNIPIYHLHGGEVSLGSFDNSIRNSISMMSDFHFVATSKSKERLKKMGINKKNIFHVGSPSIDPIFFPKIIDKKSLYKKHKIKFNKKNILVTYHLETIDTKKNKKNIKILLSALKLLKNTNIFFTGINSDPESFYIRKQILNYINKKDNCFYFANLGKSVYFSMIYHTDMTIGNSSSGIIEVPYFKKPTINIGHRQDGREQSNSIINADLNVKDITIKIKYGYSNAFQKKLQKIDNPYLKRNSNDKIVKIIKSHILDNLL